MKVTANNDTITVSTSEGSKTITNGHAKDAEGNDSNNGDGDTLTITNFAVGKTKMLVLHLLLVAHFTGSYGTLKLNADGSYTYTINDSFIQDEGISAGLR